MKVLFALIDMNIGGTEKAFLNLLHFLPKKYTITLLVLKKSGGFLEAVPPNVEIIEIENANEINQLIHNSSLSNACYFLRKFQIKSFFIIVYNFLVSKATNNPFANYKIFDFAAKKLSIKFDIAVAFAGPHDFISYYISHKVIANKKIQWVHFDVSKIYFNTKMAARLYANFDKIHLVSNDVKDNFLKVLPQFTCKSFLFKNLVADALIVQMAAVGMKFLTNEKTFDIVTIGRLTPEKGHILFIEPLKKIIDLGYNVQWIIVGDGDCKEMLIEKLAENSILQFVQFTGKTTNPYGFLKQADLYLQPSFYEGHCVTILEAKVFNKPILSTNFAGITDEITNEKTGLIVPVSSDGLFNGLLKILENKHLLDYYSENLKSEKSANNVTEIEL